MYDWLYEDRIADEDYFKPQEKYSYIDIICKAVRPMWEEQMTRSGLGGFADLAHNSRTPAERQRSHKESYSVTVRSQNGLPGKCVAFVTIKRHCHADQLVQ